MAESFAFNIAENVLGKLTSFTIQQVVSAWGLESDVEKINENLLAIRAVLLDAEKQQEHNQRIQFWLGRLKQVMYDAEDVLDEVECEALRRQVVKSVGSTSRKLRRFFSSSNPFVFRFRIANEVKRIREKIVEIAALKSDFGLTEGVNDRQVIHRETEMTHSFVDPSHVIGRDEDKEKIIHQLLDVADGTENPSVLPIVGMGGLGKTTLAKLVFNDPRVTSHFQKKVWVCVSDDFGLQNVLKKIIKPTTGEKCSDWNIEQLQRSLRETFSGEKYLLVLDDVWNDDRRKWLELKDLLMEGANGSCILVTTRDQHVAAVIGTIPAYDLDHLSDENCLSLFFSCAFNDEQDLERYPNLQKIGEEIVSKCKRIPLAVVALGTMLYSKTNEVEWKSARDSDVWQEAGILPALRISYEHLPWYLKSCFAYCSLFPKDYEFPDYELIYFWMANGLLQPRNENDNEELEEIGLRYLKELCSRSFFHVSGEVEHCDTYKMHDLMHDLAVSLTHKECSIITSTTTQQIANNTRHLLFPDPTSLPKSLSLILKRSNHVRSITHHIWGKGFTTQSTVNLCLTRFKYLRWLNLSFSQVEILPEEIGRLKHLRYLLLSFSKFKRLPKSISKLQSLQTLWFAGCEELEELSGDISCLINLRSLSITTSQKCLSKNGIGRLKSLRDLTFYDCRNLEYLFQDMSSLTSLPTLETLWITGCDSLMCLPQSMKYQLTALWTLIIEDCENLDLKMEEEEGKDAQNFTQFYLRELILVGLPKLVDLPQWLLQNTLEHLVLRNCPNLKELPACLNNLTSLQLLEIQGCVKLRETCNCETGEDWSKIAHIPNIHIDD